MNDVDVNNTTSKEDSANKSRKRHIDPDVMKNVFEAIKLGMSIRKASEKFGVPRQTIQTRMKKGNFDGPTTLGPSPYLNFHEEKSLSRWCQDLMKCGFPLKKDDLFNTVQKIVIDKNRKTPFKNDRPGKTWLRQFLKRHPELSLRVAEAISKGRAIVTEDSIRKWFSDLKQYLIKSNNQDILEDPTRILNGDETSFSMCPKTGRVLATRAYKNVYQVELANSKETITVLLVFSAAGEILPPMVVFPYVRPTKELVESMNEKWLLGKTETGWMRTETFFEYIANGVDPWLEEHQIKRPVILYVDGHKSHMSLHLSQFCDDKQIILYSLPPNTTHLTQPADVSVFRPIKQDWKKTVHEWQIENPNQSLTKLQFCPLLEKAISQNKNMGKNIKNGFRKCGLYPFNPDAVNYQACVQNNIRKLNKNVASPTNIDSEDFQTAKKVILYLTPQLEMAGINAKTIINVIQSATNQTKKLSDIVTTANVQKSFQIPEDPEEKENQIKEKKQAIEKRKIERLNKKSLKQMKKKKGKKDVANKRNNKKNIKCQECLQDCISDAEDDCEKNVGCDRCTRWFHLKCTSLCSLRFEVAQLEPFICQKCPSTSNSKAEIADVL